MVIQRNVKILLYFKWIACLLVSGLLPTLIAISAFAQLPKALTLEEILGALGVTSEPMSKKNVMLTRGVESRGITFSISNEIEKELRRSGASNELIEAIRNASPKQQASQNKEIEKANPKVSATPYPINVDGSGEIRPFNLGALPVRRGNKSDKILLRTVYVSWSSSDGPKNPSLQGKDGLSLMNEFSPDIKDRLKGMGLTVFSDNDLSMKEQSKLTNSLNDRVNNSESLSQFPFALIVEITFEKLADLPEAFDLKGATVSVSIDVLDTDTGKVAANESYRDVRGFGTTVMQARQNAISTTAQRVSEVFLKTIAEKAH